MDNPVEPGFPFQPANMDFRDGRREAFVEWLTAPANPLFARVAVNRVWGWHFGEGLQRVTSDFGLLGGKPSNPKLLDYLASEFVAHNYSMKWLHRLIVTSDTYQLSSKAEPRADLAEHRDRRRAIPTSGTSACSVWPRSRSGIPSTTRRTIWTFRLAANRSSFRLPTRSRGSSCRKMARPMPGPTGAASIWSRGYIPSTDVMNNFLTSFDVDDGRTPCPVRTQTVTAPQALFTMNGDLVEKESEKLAALVLKESSGDVRAAVTAAYQRTLGTQAIRPPNSTIRSPISRRTPSA